MSYESIPLQTPEIFEGIAPGAKVLIIGSGPSTRKIVSKKDQLRCNFNTIISCNYSFEYFDDIIDFHLVTEKTSKTSNNNVYNTISSADFRTDVPRIVHWKGIELYPDKYNLVKTTRANFNGSPDVRKYKSNGQEGMLAGPIGTQGFSLGSVVLSAMHLAAMLGAGEIYLIGADMCFKDEYDHFYNDKVYRERPKHFKKANAHKIVKVNCNGQLCDTTEYFKESGEYIDSVIPTLFKGIDIFDFSEGLITKATNLDAEDFFGEE